MSEPNRDDNRYGEDVCISFAMYCDENGLTMSEGVTLAGNLGSALYFTAEDREANLSLQPDAKKWLA